jgi:hypothetical protein
VFIFPIVILLPFFLLFSFSFLTGVCLCTFTADGDMSAKVVQELVYEKEAAAKGEQDFLKGFKNSDTWKVYLTSLFVLGVKVGYCAATVAFQCVMAGQKRSGQ